MHSLEIKGALSGSAGCAVQSSRCTLWKYSVHSLEKLGLQCTLRKGGSKLRKQPLPIKQAPLQLKLLQITLPNKGHRAHASQQVAAHEQSLLKLNLSPPTNSRPLLAQVRCPAACETLAQVGQAARAENKVEWEASP